MGEFILLSPSSRQWHGQMSGDSTPTAGTVSSEREKFLRMCDVLWIRSNGGIAYRIAMGQIHIEHWDAGEPIEGHIRLG